VGLVSCCRSLGAYRPLHRRSRQVCGEIRVNNIRPQTPPPLFFGCVARKELAEGNSVCVAAKGVSGRENGKAQMAFAKGALGKRVARKSGEEPHPEAMRMVIKIKELREEQFVGI